MRKEGCKRKRDDTEGGVRIETASTANLTDSQAKHVVGQFVRDLINWSDAERLARLLCVIDVLPERWKANLNFMFALVCDLHKCIAGVTYNTSEASLNMITKLSEVHRPYMNLDWFSNTQCTRAEEFRERSFRIMWDTMRVSPETEAKQALLNKMKLYMNFCLQNSLMTLSISETMIQAYQYCGNSCCVRDLVNETQGKFPTTRISTVKVIFKAFSSAAGQELFSEKDLKSLVSLLKGLSDSQQNECLESLAYKYKRQLIDLKKTWANPGEIPCPPCSRE